MRLPVVAVVGRPNVGKSSLVNRILGRREAIVEATPGVTRDRRSFVAEWNGRRFEIFDTGGIEPPTGELEARVMEQAWVALEAADLILLVVDCTTGPQEDDALVARALLRSDKSVLVAANKVDATPDEAGIAEFYSLGLGEPLGVSALHGRGAGDLLDRLIERLSWEAEELDDEWASIAIVGRPNVGKSSLLNRLLGADRALVDPAPGTTRDPVDSLLELAPGRTVRIIDTAGLRRRVKIDDPIEYFSFLRSRNTLRRVDGVVLVIDASAGATGHDQRIAEEVTSEGRACVLAVNKWDLLDPEPVERERFDRRLNRKVRFLDWAPRVNISALTGRGVDRLLPALSGAIESHRSRLDTALVNQIVQEAQQRRPHRRTAGGSAARVLYATQVQTSPPTFVLFSTAPLDRAYLRFIEGRLRAAGGFLGTPVRVLDRARARGKVEA